MSATRVLRLGTRGSRLALWQAHAVASRLRSSGLEPEIVVIKTSGDRSQTSPAAAPAAEDVHKREFVKELEDALLSRSIDVAVHSAKDMPVDLPDGLELAACLPREDPLDALVLPRLEGTLGVAETLERLEGKVTIGTGSIRRIAQLAALIPAAAFAPIRGNVDTRLMKLDAGGFDALMLACAGLKRLGFGARITTALPIEHCVPAPGQGIVVTETRRGDTATRLALEPMHDDAAGRCLEAERAVVVALGGGCQLPLGAIALLRDSDPATMDLHAVVASADGSRILRQSMPGPASEAAALGRRVADALLAAGAGNILDAVRR